MNSPAYVLVTPARNEEATIEITLQSVVNQTLLPMEWVIVSDQSTDSTDEIVRRYGAQHTFIRLVRLEHGSERSFSSVVHATEAGIEALTAKNYDFLGLLDADVRLKPDYYETLIGRFAADPGLGLAGGLVLDVINGKVCRGRQYLGDIAGATQFFRRKCFESIGGLVTIPEGGWDAITCVQARANGYQTATFPDLIVEHLKPRNISEGNVLRRNWQMGIRDYALGSHPVFEVVKCVARAAESPLLAGAAVRLLAFAWCSVRRRRRTISIEVMRRTRQEQINRIIPKSLTRADCNRVNRKAD
ncbi:MAG: glycosyltransferase family A protein [Syntrophobacteraceae bacterium]|jgi:glycosyltransferase involved in cell wall biosynthesis